jgi:hypothetical protein
MDVIGHNYPRPQLIARSTLARKFPKVIFHEHGDFRPTQKALAPSLVEVGLELLSFFAIVLDFCEMLPLGPK